MTATTLSNRQAVDGDAAVANRAPRVSARTLLAVGAALLLVGGGA